MLAAQGGFPSFVAVIERNLSIQVRAFGTVVAVNRRKTNRRAWAAEAGRQAQCQLRRSAATRQNRTWAKSELQLIRNKLAVPGLATLSVGRSPRAGNGQIKKGALN